MIYVFFWNYSWNTIHHTPWLREYQFQNKKGLGLIYMYGWTSRRVWCKVVCLEPLFHDPDIYVLLELKLEAYTTCPVVGGFSVSK
jgi:hypothetical protein